MKWKYLLLSFTLVFIISCSSDDAKNATSQTVNAIIGDESFEATFQTSPLPTSSENLRLTTHLKYVEQKLRNVSTDDLSEPQKQNRLACLDHLRNYWLEGEFPTNRQYKNQRRPCFIDDDGNICAVGYLVEQTAGRDIAEKINAKYQYEYVMNMDMPLIDEWAEENGFSKEELAMIQPSYGNPNPDSYVPTEQIVISGFSNGINLAASTISLANFNNVNMPSAVPMIGMASGGLTAIYGVFSMKETPYFSGRYEPTTAEKTLGLINITMGTSTLLLNAYALINNHQLRKRNMNLQSFTYQTRDRSTGVGLRFVKRF